MPYAKTNGINLYYKEYGEGDPLVLIHGLGSSLESWEVQVPIYSEHFRVIVLDNRGSGRSEKPDYPYTMEQMADDAAGLLDFLGIEKAHFVGKSMGGMICQWLGIKYPERVNRLVMGCSSGHRDEVGNLLIKTARDIVDKAGPGAGWVFALFLGYRRKYIEENYDSLISRIQEVPVDPDAAAGYRNQSYACENHDVLAQLGKISAKTLVMYGERDIVTPPERSKKLVELIPNAVEKAFADVGHGFWRECQAEVDKAVLDFLTKD